MNWTPFVLWIFGMAIGWMARGLTREVNNQWIIEYVSDLLLQKEQQAKI